MRVQSHLAPCQAKNKSGMGIGRFEPPCNRKLRYHVRQPLDSKNFRSYEKEPKCIPKNMLRIEIQNKQLSVLFIDTKTFQNTITDMNVPHPQPKAITHLTRVPCFLVNEKLKEQHLFEKKQSYKLPWPKNTAV